MLCVVCLLLLWSLCSGQHSEYQGTVLTYYPLITHPDTSVTVQIRYKSNSKSCALNDYHCPPEGCHGLSHKTVVIDQDSTKEFCQTEAIWTRKGPTNGPVFLKSLEHNWTNSTVNGALKVKASTLVELRSRSDTGQSNTSPQTTILPIYRVPWNCQRNIRLLNFDPDGDRVQCRFADNSRDANECAQCTPPSMLHLAPSCSLSFSSSSSSRVGLYSVELMMEDFPTSDMVLTATGGAQEPRSTRDPISRLAIQFLFSVESAAPSCSPGLYLPVFVQPTPEHEAQIYSTVNQTLHIYIQAQASESTFSDVLFSGPSNMTKAKSNDQYVLSWEPSPDEEGKGFPVCFVAEAVHGSAKFHSEYRCVVVHVRSEPVTTTTATTLAITTPATTAVGPTTPAGFLELRKRSPRAVTYQCRRVCAWV